MITALVLMLLAVMIIVAFGGSIIVGLIGAILISALLLAAYMISVLFFGLTIGIGAFLLDCIIAVGAVCGFIMLVRFLRTKKKEKE